MAREDARQFVAKMKENPDFRNEIAQLNAPEDLDSCLIKEGLRFSRPELVAAMAECMAQMEQ